MRVFGVPTPVFAEDYGPYVEELWTQLEDEAQKYLTEKKQQLLAQGLTNVVTIVTAGFPAEKIIDAAGSARCSSGDVHPRTERL